MAGFTVSHIDSRGIVFCLVFVAVCLDCGKWSGVVLAGSADCVLNTSGEVFKDLADRYAAFPILLVALQKISKEKDSEGMVSRAASIAIEALDKTGN